MEAYSNILAWRIPLDRGAWQTTVHRIAKSQTLLNQLGMYAHMTQQISLLGIYPKKTKTTNQERYICMPIFRATLFTIAKIWKQPNYTPKDKWINMGTVCVQTHRYTQAHIQWDITQAHKIMKYCHLQHHGWTYFSCAK